MEKLFSPWRSKYIETFSAGKKESQECVLCTAPADNDDDAHYIVTRGKLCYVIMNLFPYNSGHLLIVPFRHVPSLVDLSAEELAELMSLVQKMMKALSATSHPAGFNLGSNVGRTAGAGIEHHVHFHIVPRWEGDTNFMPVLADTKVISEDMSNILSRLRKAL